MTQHAPFPNTNKALLALIIPAMMAYSAQSTAQDINEPEVTLDTLNVTVNAKPKEEVGEEIVTRRELNEQMVQNSHDLVRYNTEVDVAEVGRYGNKGFAIRGVDGNRVNMNIDGIALPESEANEIFSPYGYMYEGRFNPDTEIMRSVRIHAGADSLTSGSGAVGGSVTYNTKQPTDLVRGDKNWGGYVKSGYTTKNEEWLQAVGLAGATDKFELMINYAERNGKETKNHAMRGSDNTKLDPNYIFTEEEVPYNDETRSLIYPNPMDYKRRSVLAKAFYNISDNHRIGLHTLYQNQDSLINVESSDVISGSRFGSSTRRAHDKERLHNYGLEYRYLFNNNILDTAHLNYTHGKVLGLADTWLYNRSFTRTCPTDPTLSWWRCPVDTVYDFESSELNERKYRPAETKSNQYTLTLNSLPLDFKKFGEHKFKLTTNYSKQDYTISGIAYSYSQNRSYFDATFPDAKKDIYNITLSDNIRIKDRLNATLGLRYDSYHYKPYFQTDIVADGKNEYERSIANCDWSGTLYCQNYREGKGLTNTKFNHLTYSGSLDYTIIPDKLDVHYKISTGFLAPTVTQIYSQFEGLGARQVPNYNLRPEKSLNQEIEFEFKPNHNTNLTFGGYYIDYKDFIHTRYWRGTNDNGCQTSPDLTCMQSQNLDNAKVYGFKLGAETDISDKFNLNGQLKLSANFHTSKDSAEIQTDKNGTQKVNTLASVPMSWIFGADYTSADKTWDLHAKLRFINHKKAKDTKTLETDYTTVQKNCVTGYENISCYYGASTYNDREYYEEVRTFKHINHSKAVALIDIYGSKKFGADKNWILNAGVYNLTNVNYMPWETLRQFNNTSANLMLDSAGYGLNRYTAPGRNYALSLTYEF